MAHDDRPLRLLIRHSADARDVALAGELLGHLRLLERFAGIDVWSETRIRAGDEWRGEVERAIGAADVALLLLSADFLASDALLNIDVPQLQRRHATGQLHVIPVLLRSCLWELHPWLKELDPLPKGGKGIASFSGEARDAVLTELVKEILGLVAPPATATKSASPNDGPASASATPPTSGGQAFVTNIIGGTVSALAVGPGSQAHAAKSNDISSDELARARLRAETAVIPFIRQEGSGFAPGDNMPVIGCVVENDGEKPFRIISARARWRPTGTTQDNPAEVLIIHRRVEPAGKATVNVKLLMTPHELSEFYAAYKRDPYESPVEAALTVVCENAAGYQGEATETVRWPVSPRPHTTASKRR